MYMLNNVEQTRFTSIFVSEHQLIIHNQNMSIPQLLRNSNLKVWIEKKLLIGYGLKFYSNNKISNFKTSIWETEN